MEPQLDIALKPFSLRHRALVAEGQLPDLGPQVRNRLWSTLRLLNEPYGYSEQHNPNWTISSSDFEQVGALYCRLLGVSNDGRDDGETAIEAAILRGKVEASLDVLECFCAWLARVDNTRLQHAQISINEALRDYASQWRLSDAQIFLVDNDYLEDELLAEVSPLLALVEFEGARAEFQRARNALLDGHARDAIFYAAASVESVFKAALPGGKSSKVGIDLAQAYANAGLLDGLPKPIAQAIQKALMPTAVLRNELAGHGHGAEVLDVPIEYAELAINLAAATNAFITRQHLSRLEVSLPNDAVTEEAAKNIRSKATASEWHDDEIPF